VLSLKIKQTEKALTDGRLEEAFELLQDASIRAHRRGQQLRTKLIERLVERGEQHLAADRHREAMADCGLLAKLAANRADVAALRARVLEGTQRRADARRRYEGTLAAARRDVDHGRIEPARRKLGQLDPTSTRVAGLAEQTEQREEAMDQATQRIREAIDRADWAAAIETWHAAGLSATAGDGHPELARRIRDGAAQAVRASLVDGRVHLAAALLDRLSGIPGSDWAQQELRPLLDRAKRAAGSIAAGRPRDAAAELQRLHRMLPEATWLEAAIEQAKGAAERMEALEAGPLGLVELSREERTRRLDGGGEAAGSGPSLRSGPALGDAPRRAEAASSAVVLHVDGAGGYLLCDASAVTIGPVSGSQPADVGLIAGPDLPTVRIERSDDDYFVTSDTPIAVNDRSTRRALLGDGDRIALTGRCRLRFHRPHSASTTAMLSVSGARLPGGGVQRIVLLDRELILGPDGRAHVRCTEATDHVIVRPLGGGRLVARSRHDDRPEAVRELNPGEPIRIAEIGLTLTPGHAGTPGMAP